MSIGASPRKTIAAMIGLFLVGGCSSAPECADTDVTDLVYEIAAEARAKTLVNRKAGSFYGAGTDLSQIINNPNLPETAKIATEALATAREIPWKLTAIRVVSIDNEIGRCECAANLEEPTGQRDITYAAQYTEDGQLLVQVVGLY